MNPLIYVPPKTAPTHDRLYMDLIKLAEACAETYKCDIYPCPKFAKCDAWNNRYAEISKQRNIKPHEQERAIAEFKKLSLQFPMKMAIMGTR